MKKLIDLIPPDELRDKLDQTCCELEPDFLCFEDVYQAVAKWVPKEYIIVDLGCYMAAQSYLFQDHKGYIGVDCYDMEGNLDLEHYIPPVRFRTKNSAHISAVIQNYAVFAEVKGLTRVSYAICSAVPDGFAQEVAFQCFENCLIWYPREKPRTKGIFAREIMKELWKPWEKRDETISWN